MYYLVIVQNNDTQAVYAHNNLDSALAAFHSELAYRAEDRTSTKCALLDDAMYVIKSEVYTKEVTTDPEQEG